MPRQAHQSLRGQPALLSALFPEARIAYFRCMEKISDILKGGADISGKNGLIGLLDNKYWERYGIPLTLSTLSNALLIGISNLTAKVPNYQTQVLFEQAGSDLSVIMQNIMRDQIKINPTLEILAGSRILIKTRSDIWFPEPKANENGVLEIITQQLQNKEEVMHNQKQSQHTRSKK